MEVCLVDASQLPEGHRNCLRMVGRGMSSKEIAAKTGLSPQTVDTYLKACIKGLGATNRREAARLLQAWELSQKSGSPTLPVAEIEAAVPQLKQAGGQGFWQLLIPIPVGGSLNDLNGAQKTLLAMRIGVTGVVMLLAIVTTFIGLLTVF